MKIGVNGASGHLGKTVVAELLARGGRHDVVGITRTPSNVPAPAEGRLGDYDDPATLLQAYAGLDRLLLIPSSDLRIGVRGRQFMAAINAALKVGVPHIVMMSISGLRHEHQPSLDAAYWTGEQHLIKSAPCWTIVRMSFFAEAIVPEILMSSRTGFLAGLGDERVAFVSRDDVAAAAAGVLSGEEHAGAIYHATGPAAVSGEERAAMVGQVTGKAIRFDHVTEEQLRGGLAKMGIPDMYMGAMLDIKRKFLRGGFDIVTGDIARLAGRKPQSFGDALPRLLAAQ